MTKKKHFYFKKKYIFLDIKKTDIQNKYCVLKFRF